MDRLHKNEEGVKIRGGGKILGEKSFSICFVTVIAVVF